MESTVFQQGCRLNSSNMTQASRDKGQKSWGEQVRDLHIGFAVLVRKIEENLEPIRRSFQNPHRLQSRTPQPPSLLCQVQRKGKGSEEGRVHLCSLQAMDSWRCRL